MARRIEVLPPNCRCIGRVAHLVLLYKARPDRAMSPQSNPKGATHKMKQLLSNLMNDESGQDLIEYALVAGLIGLGAVTAMSGLSTKIGTAFTSIGTTLSTNV